MNFIIESAIILLVICRSHQNSDRKPELTLNYNNNNGINSRLLNTCAKDLECGQQMKCVSNRCQLMPRTTTIDSTIASATTTIELSSTTTTTTIQTTEPVKIETTSEPLTSSVPETQESTKQPSWPIDKPNDMDFGSVPTTVWLSFAIPFLSIMIFLMISGYIYRRLDKSRTNPSVHHQDFFGNSPAIIDNLYDDGQMTITSRISAPPPSYDKVILEMTELPPSYDSLQNIPKN